MTRHSTDSRCTQQHPVCYIWAGEAPIQSGDSRENIAATVAERFAIKAANQELQRRRIDSKHFSQHKIKIKAFLENKTSR